MPALLGLTVFQFYSLVVEVVLISYSFVEANQQSIAARRRARDAYNASLQDRLLTIKSSVSPWKYIVGTSRTGGALLFADSDDAMRDTQQ